MKDMHRGRITNPHTRFFRITNPKERRLERLPSQYSIPTTQYQLPFSFPQRNFPRPELRTAAVAVFFIPVNAEKVKFAL